VGEDADVSLLAEVVHDVALVSVIESFAKAAAPGGSVGQCFCAFTGLSVTYSDAARNPMRRASVPAQGCPVHGYGRRRHVWAERSDDLRCETAVVHRSLRTGAARMRPQAGSCDVSVPG
jgi:hypothetical protein